MFEDWCRENVPDVGMLKLCSEKGAEMLSKNLPPDFPIRGTLYCIRFVRSISDEQAQKLTDAIETISKITGFDSIEIAGDIFERRMIQKPPCEDV